VVEEDGTGVRTLAMASRSFPPHVHFRVGKGCLEVLALPRVKICTIRTAVLEGQNVLKEPQWVSAPDSGIGR
jgi:hypothetical protein